MNRAGREFNFPLHTSIYVQHLSSDPYLDSTYVVKFQLQLQYLV